MQRASPSRGRHAVIAHECGFEISSVSAAQTHGLVEFAYPKDPTATSDCVIQTYLAGSSVWNDRRGAGSRQDLKLAREQAERAVDEGLADGDPADVYARNLGAVQDKLLRHWDKVESLARNITLLPAPVTLDGESAVAMFDMVPRIPRTHGQGWEATGPWRRRVMSRARLNVRPRMNRLPRIMFFASRRSHSRRMPSAAIPDPGSGISCAPARRRRRRTAPLGPPAALAAALARPARRARRLPGRQSGVPQGDLAGQPPDDPTRRSSRRCRPSASR